MGVRGLGVNWGWRARSGGRVRGWCDHRPGTLYNRHKEEKNNDYEHTQSQLRERQRTPPTHTHTPPHTPPPHHHHTTTTPPPPHHHHTPRTTHTHIHTHHTRERQRTPRPIHKPTERSTSTDVRGGEPASATGLRLFLPRSNHHHHHHLPSHPPFLRPSSRYDPISCSYLGNPLPPRNRLGGGPEPNCFCVPVLERGLGRVDRAVAHL